MTELREVAEELWGERAHTDWSDEESKPTAVASSLQIPQRLDLPGGLQDSYGHSWAYQCISEQRRAKRTVSNSAEDLIHLSYIQSTLHYQCKIHLFMKSLSSGRKSSLLDLHQGSEVGKQKQNRKSAEALSMHIASSSSGHRVIYGKFQCPMKLRLGRLVILSSSSW